MENHDFENINDILKRAVKNLHLDEKSVKKLKKNTELKERWAELVGVEISKHTEPVNIKKGVITITVDSSSWLYELNSFARETLLKTLKTKYHHIKDVRFKLGKIKRLE